MNYKRVFFEDAISAGLAERSLSPAKRGPRTLKKYALSDIL